MLVEHHLASTDAALSTWAANELAPLLRTAAACADGPDAPEFLNPDSPTRVAALRCLGPLGQTRCNLPLPGR